ncbi:serpentine type 7TM GPCR chemoreceptor str domain-containing protein [Ditylenchus destructor]|uniref:Serpentine type 7TM GPCR chemoreceptor str domain-containing protein n=1 Tax=Ditylenchus destructor TaxID=166010 RepID=A0AAD4N6L5_9BILA|nr:serpentine type 7TM GPCR chemoreceptor str domain-containing protein [Ditylenchus destructor]
MGIYWRIYASRLHAINDYTIATCGLTLNAILVWLVINRSAKEMKIYSKILLQTCIIDFALLTFIMAVQPIYLVHDGWNLLVSNGPFRAITHPWNYMLMATWFFIVYFSIVSNCVPFIYRYLVICKLKVISAFQYFLMLVGCAYVIVLYICMLTWSTYPREAQRNRNYTEVIEILGMNIHNSSQFQIGLMMKTQSIPWAITCAFIITMEVISYSIIAVCGIKIRKFVQCTSRMSQQTDRQLEVHRQISFVLIMQTLMPILEMSTSLFCMILSITLDTKANVYAAMFAIMPFHWVPLFNPVVTIWVIKPYRKFFSFSAIHHTSSETSVLGYKD